MDNTGDAAKPSGQGQSAEPPRGAAFEIDYVPSPDGSALVLLATCGNMMFQLALPRHALETFRKQTDEAIARFSTGLIVPGAMPPRPPPTPRRA